MKTYTVTLTEKEMTALQVALSAHILHLDEKCDHLSKHNTTGINTWKIEQWREWITAELAVQDKLYEIKK